MKDKIEVLFYIIAIIGILDMTMQSITDGKIKPIHDFLAYATNQPESE